MVLSTGENPEISEKANHNGHEQAVSLEQVPRPFAITYCGGLWEYEAWGLKLLVMFTSVSSRLLFKILLPGPSSVAHLFCMCESLGSIPSLCYIADVISVP